MDPRLRYLGDGGRRRDPPLEGVTVHLGRVWELFWVNNEDYWEAFPYDSSDGVFGLTGDGAITLDGSFDIPTEEIVEWLQTGRSVHRRAKSPEVAVPDVPRLESARSLEVAAPDVPQLEATKHENRSRASSRSWARLTLPRVMGPIGWWRRRQAKRDAQAALQLKELRAWADATPNALLLRVRSVYQHARRGTKAFVKQDHTGQERDAWFWSARVHPGEVVAVKASSGWGPHSNRKDVLYVGGEHAGSGVHTVLPAKTVKAALRHFRQARTARRIASEPAASPVKPGTAAYRAPRRQQAG